MIRVAHIALQLDTGGMERLLTEYARHADRSRFELRFVALGGRGRLAEEIEACGWPVIAMGARPGVRPLLIHHLARLFASERVDLVHTHNTKPLLYAGPAARLAGVGGVVHTRHGQRRGHTRLQNSLFKLASRCADRMVCVSGDAARRCREEGVAAHRVHTIPNGIDTSRFSACGGRSGGPAVYVGRLSPEKDVANLLRAAAVVAGRVRSFRLEIAGDGPCRGELERLARGLGLDGCVRFLGEVSDVAGLLRGAGLFVLPSLSEGMPVTVLEAMATGLPVVATAVGGTQEAVDRGITGLLVPPGDAGALGEAMARVLAEPEEARRMGLAGRRRVEDHFDIRAMVGRYEFMYSQVVKRRMAA